MSAGPSGTAKASARRLGIVEAVTAVMTVAALGLMVLAPFRVFRVAPGKEGEATCLVTGAFCGVYPLWREEARSVVSASSSSRTEVSSRRSNGRTKRTTTRVTELSLSDAAGRELYGVEDSHLIGASFETIAADVEQVVAREAGPGPVVRWNAAWPPLLASSLLLFLGGPYTASALGLALHRVGMPNAIHVVLFHVGPFLVTVALLATMWFLAFFGNAPPAAIVKLLGHA